MINMNYQICFILFLVPFFGCSEAPLIAPENFKRLNNPISMAFVPNTNLAVVANANVNLNQETGSLVAIDLSSASILTETSISIPSFSGRITLHPSLFQIYVPDRGDDALLVYEYTVPAPSGLPISIIPKEVVSPQARTINGIETDENPFDVFLFNDLLLVTNHLSGSVSFISASSLDPIDLDPQDSQLNGLPLVSAANFTQAKRRSGIGANRIIPAPNGLLYVTSTRTNNIYVIDPKSQQVEAMLDLSTLSLTGGTRGMVVSGSGLAYIAHRGINSLIILDVSEITDNGIDFEVADVKLVDVIPVGADPEGVALSPDEKTVFVSNQGDNSITVIDTVTRTIKSHIFVSGTSPGEIVVDSTRNLLYVLNFLSNDISVIDINTLTLVQIIQ